MPLTHVTSAISGEDIVRHGMIDPKPCAVFNEKLAYFFYGRPAYRIGAEGAVKVEAACPFCFIFDASLIKRAKSIYAFDTGAFSNRMYKHAFVDEMDILDFSLEKDNERPNRLIHAVFKTKRTYFDGDISKALSPEDGAKAWEFHARAYLELINSKGRNEPDDRICSIEVVLGEPVALNHDLKAVVVPHTLWDTDSRAPWLEKLEEAGVVISPYLFVPGRHPEHYHAMMEVAVRELYQGWKLL